METHDYLKPLAIQMTAVKERRNFFVHRFLFNRYGGELFTLDEEYEVLIREATELRDLFAAAYTSFLDFMLNSAPLMMFSAKRDPDTGEIQIVKSKFSQPSKT
jgi:hypothetical protein